MAESREWGSSPRIGYSHLARAAASGSSRRRAGSSPVRSTGSSPVPLRGQLSRSDSFNRGNVGYYSSEDEQEVGRRGGPNDEYHASMLGRSRLLFPPRRWNAILSLNLWRAKDFQMEVSPQDERTYRLVRLPNDLRVLLVSDSKSEKGAAAMCVRVGAAQDPPEAPGVAHFLEHMLFLGTEKYPIENTYKEMVNRNGGRSNASTSMDRTVYQFEVTAEKFDDVLDVFSQFFVAPLFTESATEREMHAVDSENSKNLTDDGRRFLQIQKAVADPNHPWSKFSTGNLATLRDNVPPGFSTREALMDLHKRYYYASNMALTVLSPEPLDALEAQVRGKFSAIPTKHVSPTDEAEAPPPPPSATQPPPVLALDGKVTFPPLPAFHNPFPPQCTPEGEAAFPLVRVIPLRDKRVVEFAFPVPPVRTLYRSSPDGLLGHLFGHEGEGSIYAVVHGLGWATSLSSGVSTSQEGFCLFNVNVNLTEEGLKHWQEIGSLVFTYLRLINQTAEEDLCAMWDEIRAISSTNFRFVQKASEYSYVTDLARRLQLYRPEHVLSAGHLHDELDVPTFAAYLSFLTPENMLVFLTAKENEGKANKTEKWYGHQYGHELIPVSEVHSWTAAQSDGLHLPRPNPFICEDFEVLAREFEPPSATPSPPTLSRASSFLQLWYKQDRSFKQPRATIRLDLLTPVVTREPALAELLVRYVDHALAESTYDATLAGLRWSISTTARGYSLTFSGFSHKLQTLVHRVLESFIQLSIQEKLFALCKERAIQVLRNVRLARPDQHCSIFHDLLTQEGRWDWRDKLERAQTYEPTDLIVFHKQVLSSLCVRLGVFGNIEEISAVGLSEQVEMLFQRNPKFRSLSPSMMQPLTRYVQLEPGVEYRLRAKVPNQDDENSAVYTYFQLGLMDVKLYSRLMLLAQILKEPAFTQLRTREQLGYIVSAEMNLRWLHTMIGGLAFRVLSKTHAPEQISGRIEAFVEDFVTNKLPNLEPEQYARHKASLITNCLEPYKTLGQEASFLWSEVENATLDWQRHKHCAEAVEATSLDDTVALARTLLLERQSRKKLGVFVYGNQHRMPSKSTGTVEEKKDVGSPTPKGAATEEEGVVYLAESDWLAFRQSRPLFPSWFQNPASKY